MKRLSLTTDETISHLDKVSPTFCGAKWTQALFQLHLGKIHNCCLTPGTQIDKNNFFNSSELIEQRKSFLNGEKIKECNPCWSAEDKGLLSDRIYKSSEPNVFPLYDPKVKVEAEGVKPTYIEISLSNRCQFRCAYCSPENSSSLYGEIKEHGPYLTTENFGYAGHLVRGENFYLENDDNPYIDKFIEWFPEISSTLQVLRFTGGEPLLSHKLFELLDLLKQNPSPDLELIFNSNLGIQPKVLDQFLDHLKMMPAGSYGEVTFITSVDGWGDGAELARWGLDLNLFERNFKKIREVLPDTKIRFTSTINIYALPGLKDLLVKIYEWKQNQSFSDQILITAYPLYYPAFLSPAWCKDELEEARAQAIKFVDEHFVGDAEANGFKSVERDMLVKALDIQNTQDVEKNLIDYTLFTIQHQSRKKWEDSRLPESAAQIFDKGKTLLADKFSKSELDPLTALKCIGKIDLNQKNLQNLLSERMKDGAINPWAIIDVQVACIHDLDESWADWWLSAGEPDAAFFLLRNREYLEKVKVEKLILSHVVNSKPQFWTNLTTGDEIFEKLSPSTLKRMLLLSPKPFLGEHWEFWKKVRLKYPNFF